MISRLYFLTPILSHFLKTSDMHHSQSVCVDAFTRRCIHSSTPLKCSPVCIGLVSLFLLTLFPLQMTALTREMSGSPWQRFLASSNICEVLSSSPQLRKGSLSGICAADPQHGKDGQAKCTQAHPLCLLIRINERLY